MEFSVFLATISFEWSFELDGDFETHHVIHHSSVIKLCQIFKEVLNLRSAVWWSFTKVGWFETHHETHHASIIKQFPANLSPDTKFECKPYNTYRFYQEEWVRYVRHLIFLDFCAIGCRIEHLKCKKVGQNLLSNFDALLTL